MNNNSEQNNISKEILERIRSGEVQMRPRLYFVIKTMIVLVLATFIFLVSIWLVSFISFGLRLSGNESLLQFGTRGTYLFLMLFPWGLALLDVALIVLLGWIVRRFRFGYRKPLLYVFGVAVAVIVLAGLLFDRETPFHDDRFEEAEAGELVSPFGFIYESAHSKTPEEHGVYRGFVLEVREDSFVLTHDDHDEDEDDGTWNVVPPLGFDIGTLRVGDKVYVVGEREEGSVEAYGVRVLKP